jgi:YD repeat-containing protein
VLIRSVFRGRVRFTAPHRFVGEDAGRLLLYRSPGSEVRYLRRDAQGRYLERWVGDEETTSFRWARTHVLLRVRPEDAHSLDLFWDEAWNFLGWYVNLQTPLRRSPLGFDMTDHALDVWVEPGGRWAWKDEADFAEAQRLGVFDAREAEAVRAEGRRVIAAKPWPTGWESWRPPPEWTPLNLPAGWDAV